MVERLKQTVRIIRRDVPDPAELELVSTQMLTRLLEENDEQQKQALREVASGADGLLAHDAENNRFEIIEDDDLQAALNSAQGSDLLKRTADVVLEADLPDEDAEELSLVSTMMLKQFLSEDGIEMSTDDGPSIDEGGGFDPYNSG